MDTRNLDCVGGHMVGDRFLPSCGGEKPSRRAPAQDLTSTELAAALAKDPKAAAAFAALTPGRQREYATHINSAKREATRQKRVEDALPLIRAGKGLNDRYR